MIPPREAVRLALAHQAEGLARAHGEALQATARAVECALASATCPTCHGRPARYEGRSGLLACACGHRWPLGDRAGGAEAATEDPQVVLARQRAQLLALDQRLEAAQEPEPARAVSREGVVEVALKGPITPESADAFEEVVALARAAGPKALLLSIDSEGGNLASATRMIAALRAAAPRVVASIQGYCASAATLVALSADFIVMGTRGELLVHAPSNGTDEERAGWRESMIASYACRTALSDMAVREAFATGDLELDASAALAGKWIDDVGDERVARAVAEAFAAGRPPSSTRGAVLASRVQRNHADPHQRWN